MLNICCTHIQIVKEQIWMIFQSQPKTRCRSTPCCLLEVNGFKPMNVPLVKRSALPVYLIAHHFWRTYNGGGERVRTDGLLRARQALSQLSYTPNKICDRKFTIENLFFQSNWILNLQLSIINQTWWAWMELNHRPHAYQACALTKLSYRPTEILECQITDLKLVT